MFGAPKQDQTDPTTISQSSAEELGSGMFAVVTLENGRPQGTIQTVPDITYACAQEYGAQCISFKWVPHRVASYETILAGCPTEGTVCHHIVTCGVGCMCYGIGMIYKCTSPRSFIEATQE